ICIFLLSLHGICNGHQGGSNNTQNCKKHGPFMDDSAREAILKFHNGFRTQLAKGLSPGYQGKHLLPAQDLFNMIWSCNLEEKALKATEKCAHYNVRRENYAQNIY
ncbi:hypothetical protein TELCIR_09646, partial [Teladorsagia circumcincta]